MPSVARTATTAAPSARPPRRTTKPPPAARDAQSCASCTEASCARAAKLAASRATGSPHHARPPIEPLAPDDGAIPPGAVVPDSSVRVGRVHTTRLTRTCPGPTLPGRPRRRSLTAYRTSETARSRPNEGARTFGFDGP
jgi:hypothetical protein